LTRGSEEGIEKGLGWIEADTIEFDGSKMDADLKIPHMGWSDVELVNKSPLFSDMYNDPRFYFVHKYYMRCDHEQDIVVTARHGYSFTAGVQRGNIYGMQFHPEKSHKYGMRLLENFIKISH